MSFQELKDLGLKKWIKLIKKREIFGKLKKNHKLLLFYVLLLVITLSLIKNKLMIKD